MKRMVLFSLFLSGLLALAQDAPQTRSPFAEIDIDQDGVITLTEFNTHHQLKFETLDQDGDGSLSTSEWPQRPHRGPRLPFAEMDLDQNKEITAEEWLAFVQSLPTDEEGNLIPPEERPEPFFQVDLDQNRDGKVNPEELLASFAFLDRNQDGVINVSDRIGFPGEHQKRHVRGRGLGHSHSWMPLADQNEDGSISQEEWTTFGNVGLNEQGVIDVTRLVSQSLQPRQERMTSHLTNQLDADQSGQISSEEWQQFFLNHDRNADGVVDEDDRPSQGMGKRPRHL